MADRPYERQIIRFLPGGVNLSVPPELVPPEQYTRLTDAIVNRDGTVQAQPGGILVLTAAGVHSLRRLSRYRDNATIFVIGNGPFIQWASGTFPAGGLTALELAMSTDPVTMVPYRTRLTSSPFMYIGDRNRMSRIGWNASDVVFKSSIGILRRAAAVTAVASGAGNLNGAYDWRIVYRESSTNTRSNPTDVNATSLTLTNQSADVSILASPNTRVDEIRLYRRGGTLTDDWRLVTTLSNTDQTYNDNIADADTASAEIIELDNDVPVTSVNSSGVTLEGTIESDNSVPLPYIWGVVEETLFGCGDPNRPDIVYFTKKTAPESWPAANYLSLDVINDKAVSGFVYNGKSFCFTRKDLFALIPNIIDGRTWTPMLTPCGHGIVGPYAHCVGERVWFCAEDGIYEWGEGEAVCISDAIRPLFPYHGAAGYDVPVSNVYHPVDFGSGIGDNKNIRMAYHNREVYLFYKDTNGNPRVAVYTIDTKGWRFLDAPNNYMFGYSDEAPQSIMLMGMTDGVVVRLEAGTTNGVAVSPVVETGGHDQGFPRADKEYGDAAVWANCSGGTVNVVVFVNSNFTATVASAILTGSGLQRYVIPLNGIYGRHIHFRFSWNVPDAGTQPILYWIETYYLPHPEEIIERRTDWDDVGYPTDKLFRGIVLTADTRGNVIPIQLLKDDGTVGAIISIGPNTAGRPKPYNIGFPSFRARKVRLVPIPDVSLDWKFYGINKWLFDPEPEAMGWHEVYWNDAGYPHDKLVKGVVIEAMAEGQTIGLRALDDTGAIQKTFNIGPGTAGIPAIYEVSFTSFRSRNIRLLSTQAMADWKLFRVVRWIYDPEPMDITHWETQELTHGFQGFHWERDSYVEVRSDGVVTITVTVDGTDQNPVYTTASTGGTRKRIYLPFRANKGKLYRYQMDASTGFHLYDFAVRAKQWDGADYADLHPSFAGK